MLSVRSGQRHRIRSTRRPANELEEEFAQPETPIPVILARDEEMGLYDNASDDEVPKVIQHPPPAYGLWRSSVVSAENVLPCLCARLLTFSSVRILTSYTGNESLLPSGSVWEKLQTWLNTLPCVRQATAFRSRKRLRVFIRHHPCPCLDR